MYTEQKTVSKYTLAIDEELRAKLKEKAISEGFTKPRQFAPWLRTILEQKVKT